MLKTRYIKTLIAATSAGACLTACGGDTSALLPADSLGLRATAQIEAGVKAEKITVIPNTTAGWTSQILLLAEGQVSRTRVDGGKSQAVNAGDVKDIIGLKRESAAGVALTLTPDGTLRALIEKDDEGRLGRMNVSAKAANYTGFCQYSEAPVDTLIVMSGQSLVTLEISFEGNDVISLREISRDKYAAPVSACFVKGKDIFARVGGKILQNKASLLGAQNVTTLGVISAGGKDIILTTPNQQLVRTRLSAPNSPLKVTIEDGLSIRGTSQVTAVYTSAENLGSTFNKGVVIAQDGYSDRLILIAYDYAGKALNRQAAPES